MLGVYREMNGPIEIPYHLNAIGVNLDFQLAASSSSPFSYVVYWSDSSNDGISCSLSSLEQSKCSEPI
jgi:hypothetical protein